MKKGALAESVRNYFERGINAFLPHLSVNCVVFGFDGSHLKVLIHRFGENEFWMLPGGYIYREENLDAAAQRNLSLWGLEKVLLRQFQTFGEAQRVNDRFMTDRTSISLPNEIYHWVTQRFVTVGYYALVDYTKVQLEPGPWSSECIWMDIDHLPDLFLDHTEIVRKARKVLSEDLLNYPVLQYLLPERFSIPELQQLYEAILNRTIDRGTFRRKIVGMGILENAGKQSNAERRPAYLFTLNQQKYADSLLKKVKFGF